MKCLFFCQDVISKKNTGVGWALLSDVESTQKAVEYMRNGEVGKGKGKGEKESVKRGKGGNGKEEKEGMERGRREWKGGEGGNGKGEGEGRREYLD